jgi:hypothetical protein
MKQMMIKKKNEMNFLLMNESNNKQIRSNGNN